MQKVYLDYQATTPLDPEVFEVMKPYFLEKFGNPHSSDHSFGWEAAAAVEVAAASVGKMVGADADEIIFTSGATESNNLAILGVARKSAPSKRHKMFIGSTEHKCVLVASEVAKSELDFEVHRIPVDQEGLIDLNWLAERVDEKTLLVSVMAVNNEIGTIAQLKDLSYICSEKGVLLHTDAAQAPCAIETSLLADCADLLSLSAHKMYGPKGIGALYIRREVQALIEPLIHGGGQQRNLRSGTLPVPLIAGFGKAAELVNTDAHKTQLRDMKQTQAYLWRQIKSGFPTAILNGPSLTHRHPGNLNIQFPGHFAKDLLLRLQPMVAASTGSACTTGIEEPSHILSAIGLSAEKAECSIRFSIGRQTTINQLDQAVELILNLLQLHSGDLGN